MTPGRGLRPYAKTQHRATRLGNRRLVLQGIFDDGPISRAGVARATGLGKATVSDITSDLIGEGLVVEVGQGTSTGGKPPTLVELDPDGRFTVAVDLSRHPVEAALLNLRGRIVDIASGKALSPTGNDVLEEIHRLVVDLMGAAAAPALGLGIGVPGTVDDAGRVLASEQLGWTDVQLRDALEDVYGLPVYVAGDAEVAAVAEFGRTGSDPTSDMLYVKVDDRIAVGVILGGQLHRTSHRGGDLTHLTIPGWTKECRCGSSGCLGTELSVIEILGEDYLDLGTDARSRLAAETAPRVDEAARALGRVLAPIVAVLDIDRVVVGGQFAEWPLVPGLAAGVIRERLNWSVDVVPSRLGSSAVLLGAAGMVLSGELGVVWG
ncbi:MAG: ROK family protein [Actinomycetota bacterium]|nr:ROK family protein [Actinomycetota bacterium]